MSDMHKEHNKDKRQEHMERRKEHLTYRQMQEDFGISKSKIHRDLRDKKNSDS